MKVQQQAGNCEVVVYTDGAPLWPDITITAANGDRHKIRATRSELHDLRYCIGRVLAQLEEPRR